MNTHKFVVEDIRFHLNVPDTLIFVGWFYDGNSKNHELNAQLDGKELPTELLLNKGVEIRQKYIRCVNQISEEIVGVVKLPPEWRDAKKLSIESSYRGNSHRDALYSVQKLKQIEHKIQYGITNVRIVEGKLMINGWCMGSGELKVSLLDAQKQPLTAKIDHFCKKDAERVGPEDEKREKLFFSVQTEWKNGIKYYLEIRNENGAECERVDRWGCDSVPVRIWRKGRKAVQFFKRNGTKATLVRIYAQLGAHRKAAYEHWQKKYSVTAEELEEQRRTQEQFAFCPKFSVAIPLYRTGEPFLRELIASLQNQTYGNWELCLADGSEDGGKRLSALIAEYQKDDTRIQYRLLEKNAGIAQNTNEAMQMAQGDFIVLLDHDDTLAPNALFELAKAANQDKTVDVIYSDEDKMDTAGQKYFEPHFKPDFDLDFFLCNNYICHLFAVKREIAEGVGGFHTEYDGSQDYDFILRCCEKAQRVYHVPKVLYHWRCHYDSTAANPQSKLYAFEAGRRALEAHYERCKIPAEVEHAEFNGLYRTRYRWSGQPLVSVLIISQNETEKLKDCVESVLWSDYKNYEIVIADTGSANKETLAYYDKLTAGQENIRVAAYEGDCSLAKLYNFAEKNAKGDYLLFLNPKTQMMDETGMREMLGYCMREDVGAVGAKIIYDDDTICHAGIVLGFDGTAGYVFHGESRYMAGYESRVLCAQDYSAVSGMAMMVKKNVYERAGGMSEEFPDAFCDIDFCLKVRKAGFLVVYQPYAQLLYHGEKAKGFGTEAARLFKEKWGETIKAGDPYYNPNLTLDKLDFSLRR